MKLPPFVSPGLKWLFVILLWMLVMSVFLAITAPEPAPSPQPPPVHLFRITIDGNSVVIPIFGTNVVIEKL